MLRCFVCFWHDSPHWARASSFAGFLDHTQRRITVGRNPLDEWSSRRRDLYLTTHNTNNRQTSMPPMGIEPTILVGERPQTYFSMTINYQCYHNLPYVTQIIRSCFKICLSAQCCHCSRKERRTWGSRWRQKSNVYDTTPGVKLWKLCSIWQYNNASSCKQRAGDNRGRPVFTVIFLLPSAYRAWGKCCSRLSCFQLWRIITFLALQTNRKKVFRRTWTCSEQGVCYT
jgi:hypothetical protein